MTRRHKIDQLRQRAVVLRHNAARDLVEANRCDEEAERLAEQEEAREVANGELAKMFFAYTAKLRRAH